MRGERLTDDQLLSLIEAQENDALGSPVAAGAAVGSAMPADRQMTTLQVDSYNALNTYYGRPRGDEVDGRSTIVIPEMRDTIEWEVPQLMRIFTAGPVCEFDPNGPDDVKQAELETAAVQHVFMNQNNGFILIHDMIKDSRILRNGYARASVEEVTDPKTTTYSGLNQIEMAMVLSDNKDEELEVLEQRAYLIDGPVDQGTGQRMPPMQVFDLKVRRTKTVKKIKIDCMPPEEMLVSTRARDGLEDCDFIQHHSYPTRTQLIEDGFDADQVYEATPEIEPSTDLIPLARMVVTDQLAMSDPADKSQQTVCKRDIYMRVDYDGDGVAELRHIVLAGRQILVNEEADEHGYVTLSAVRMPHRLLGLSAFDELADVQGVKTSLTRGLLDNAALVNNPRIAVDWNNVNLDDLLNAKDGGIIRTEGPPGNSLMPFEHPFVGDKILPVLDYVDSWREMRTGVGKNTVSVDPDALQNVTKGAMLAGMQAASLKLEMKARLIAHGIGQLFCAIHSLMRKHQDQPMQFQFMGQWVTVDPTRWGERTSVTPAVGLGSGQRDEMKQNLMMLAQAQQQLGSMGLVGPRQAYAVFRKMAGLLGFNNPEQFAMDPDGKEFQAHVQAMAAANQQHAQQQPPNPMVQVAQIKAQSDAAGQQAETQRAVMKLQQQLLDAKHENLQAQQQHLMDMQTQNRDHIQDAASRQQDAASQLGLALLKVLGPIVASQLKQDPNAPAGQVLARDVRDAEGGLT